MLFIDGLETAMYALKDKTLKEKVSLSINDAIFEQITRNISYNYFL